MERSGGRPSDGLRPVRFEPGYLRRTPGSVLVRQGFTRVLCTASASDRVPGWLRGRGRGWVTAEYGMLPMSSSGERIRRERKGLSGRSTEIGRLIGRSLRAAVDLPALGERLIQVDCDVIEADGGTRTAAITGGFVALALALDALCRRRLLRAVPLTRQVAAVSVGVVRGAPLLDLDYREDSRAEVDLNVVQVPNGPLVELQGAAEQRPFSRGTLDRLLDLAAAGIAELGARQRAVLAGVPLPAGW